MIAAVIAAIAVFPVWRQVRLQGMQTDILKSEVLRHRISTLGGMRDTRWQSRLKAYKNSCSGTRIISNI
jgi:hypothetical protein